MWRILSAGAVTFETLISTLSFATREADSVVWLMLGAVVALLPSAVWIIERMMDRRDEPEELAEWTLAPLELSSSDYERRFR